MDTKKITMYGANWCGDCRRSKAFFDQNKVEYEFIDIDSVPGAADKVVEINDGLRTIPTIVFPDGTVLLEPSNQTLKDKLQIT